MDRKSIINILIEDREGISEEIKEILCGILC